MTDLTNITDVDDRLMERALELAAEAAEAGEVPVGAVVVDESGAIVGEGRNTREADKDPLGHAELIAIAQASKRLGRWRLSGCTLYVTLEPCFMCAGALVNARVDRLVFGAKDPKAGAVGSLGDVCRDSRLNHRLVVDSGVRADDCGAVLKSFFRLRRQAGKQQPPHLPQPLRDDDDSSV
jgi:tRNA(adenine34) deaminase